MLHLTDAEVKALAIVVLKTDVKQERYGAAHQHNWKKVGLSRAYYKKVLVCEESMPTARAKAAYRFLAKNNRYYDVFLREQRSLLQSGAALSISSYDLFIVQKGIECAMFPHLYPTTDFTDTGIMANYMHKTGDTKNRVVSIGLSFTRKVLSSVRVYAEQRDLPFFLYEKHMAMKYFAAQTRAKTMGLTGDVLARDSQSSIGYWEIVQDSLADLVRIMAHRCYDEHGYPQLYNYCRGLRGAVWQCAFPNLFITVAPAEWKFFRPYFLEPYIHCIFAGAYMMALHMYFLVRCIWLFLANRFGHKYFMVFEWCMKTEYQERGTPHWHFCAWVVSFIPLKDLEGRKGKKAQLAGYIVSAFVRYLSLLFQCEIDVQTGNGRINYISGYVAKDHDAVDVGLGEYVQKNASTSWLATYRLLSKSTPCLPEVAIRMAQLSEFERSYSHVLLFPPQPIAMMDYREARNFSAKMYQIYLLDKRKQATGGAVVCDNFLTWHRDKEYDPQAQQMQYRTGRHNARYVQTQVVACRYWFELTDGYWGQYCSSPGK